MKKYWSNKRKYDRPLFRSMCVDQFPGKSLGVRVVFANKLKAVQLVIAKKYADVVYYGLYD